MLKLLPTYFEILCLGVVLYLYFTFLALDLSGKNFLHASANISCLDLLNLMARALALHRLLFSVVVASTLLLLAYSPLYPVHMLP